MKKADSGDVESGTTMNDALMQRAQLSAMADGQLDASAMNQALDFAAQEDGATTWQMYHLIGDVLRSPELAEYPAGSLVANVRRQISRENLSQPSPILPPVFTDTVVADGLPPAANSAIFRWKMLAGLASLAAVTAIGWTALTGLQAGGVSGSTLASRGSLASGQQAPVLAVADKDNQPVMIRDPRLDELLAAHKQFGSTSALQMPADFLRNATFATPSR